MGRQKVLVTGGAGYIGAHTVVQLYDAGYQPVIIDNLSKSDKTLLRGIESITGSAPAFVEGDCVDKTTLRNLFQNHGPFRCILHFAAFKSVGESVENPLVYYQNNIGSLLTLLEVMKETNHTDLIFSSSCTVYGQPDKIPVTEGAPFKKAESPYGATKQMCERILEDSHRTGLRIISLRYFNPIGAHPSGKIGEPPVGIPNNLVPYITQTAAGIRERLSVFGDDYDTPDGSCVRDFIHVVDLAIAHVKAMEFLGRTAGPKLFEAFNLGTGEGVSVLQLLKEFTKVTGVTVPFVIAPRRPGDVEKVFGDPSKAKKVMNWETKFSIQESLMHAWQWQKYLSKIS